MNLTEIKKNTDQSVNQIIISRAKKEDVTEIVNLQQDLLINNNENKDNGFLVSAFNKKDYLTFIDKYNYFFVAKINNKICGVIMAYHSSLIHPENKTNMLLKYSLKSNFILIKQIFVSKKYSSNGIASQLYKYLFSIENSIPYIAVIVNEPINMASNKFHSKFAFSNYLDFEPDADKDKIVRCRSAWIKLPNRTDEIHDFIRFTNIKQIEDFGETIMSRSSELVSLYAHEDNLNWTKMGMQITLIFALFASFIYFYEKDIIPQSIPIIVILAIWGITINFVFYLKIKSGLQFMDKHKANIKTLDKKINIYFPMLPPIFPKNSKIAEQSITVKLLPWLSLLGMISWICVSILLLFKGFHVFSLPI